MNTAEVARATRLPFRVTGADFQGNAKLVAVSTGGRSPTETISVVQACSFDSRPGRPGTTVNGLKMSRDWTITVPLGGGGGDSDWKQDFTVGYTIVSPSGTEDVRSHEVTAKTYRDAGK